MVIRRAISAVTLVVHLRRKARRGRATFARRLLVLLVALWAGAAQAVSGGFGGVGISHQDPGGGGPYDMVGGSVSLQCAPGEAITYMKIWRQTDNQWHPASYSLTHQGGGYYTGTVSASPFSHLGGTHNFNIEILTRINGQTRNWWGDPWTSATHP